MIELKDFNRPSEIIIIKNNLKNILISKIGHEQNIIKVNIDKKKKFKQIKKIFPNSLITKYDENHFIDFDQKGTGFLIRKLDGKINKKYKISKQTKYIECLYFHEKEKKLVVLDSKFNQYIEVNIKNLDKIKIKEKVIKKIDLNFSKFCYLENNQYLIVNKKNFFLVDKDFNILKKKDIKKKGSNFYFRFISSIKFFDKRIVICDSLNYKIYFLDKSLNIKKEIGWKGKELGKFDLPMNLNFYEKNLIISDKNNDRIVLFNQNNFKLLVKKKYDPKILSRPIKAKLIDNKLALLDRDNSRIIFYDKNLNLKRIVKIKNFINGKPNSFDFLYLSEKKLIVVLYRFTNLSNKILIFNFTGSLTKTMNLDLKDAQDMTIFNENLYVSNTNNRSLIRYNFLSKFINEINLTKFTKNNLLLCKAVCNDSLGNTYISDFKKCIVLKFDQNLKILKKIYFNEKQFKVIRGLYIFQNYLFILNRGINPLIIYDLKRKKIKKKFSNKELYFPLNPSSVIYFSNKIYIVDKENDRFLKIKYSLLNENT